MDEDNDEEQQHKEVLAEDPQPQKTVNKEKKDNDLETTVEQNVVMKKEIESLH